MEQCLHRKETSSTLAVIHSMKITRKNMSRRKSNCLTKRNISITCKLARGRSSKRNLSWVLKRTKSVNLRWTRGSWSHKTQSIQEMYEEEKLQEPRIIETHLGTSNKMIHQRTMIILRSCPLTINRRILSWPTNSTRGITLICLVHAVHPKSYVYLSTKKITTALRIMSKISILLHSLENLTKYARNAGYGSVPESSSIVLRRHILAWSIEKGSFLNLMKIMMIIILQSWRSQRRWKCNLSGTYTIILIEDWTTKEKRILRMLWFQVHLSNKIKVSGCIIQGTWTTKTLDMPGKKWQIFDSIGTFTNQVKDLIMQGNMKTRYLK